jgi:hypothetical protein
VSRGAPGATQGLRRALLLLPLVAGLASGCSSFQAAKVLAPESFGLLPVGPHLHVEAGADPATQAQLREAMARAEQAIRSAYGSVNTHPRVNACVSEACYTAFGGRGSVAKVYGDRILLSPRGLNWHFLAHEWSHAEMRSRLTLLAWWHMPQWFDEGVAVAISEAPEHAEAHLQVLADMHTPRPSTEELYSFKTLSQWLAGVHEYGEDTNIQRHAQGLPEIRPLYASAGHELRPWLAAQGVTGLLAFIAELDEGQDFMSAYLARRELVHLRTPIP